jgi:hypothetical protein
MDSLVLTDYPCSASRSAATQFACAHLLPPNVAAFPSYSIYSWQVLKIWLKCLRNHFVRPGRLKAPKQSGITISGNRHTPLSCTFVCWIRGSANHLWLVALPTDGELVHPALPLSLTLLQCFSLCPKPLVASCTCGSRVLEWFASTRQ